MKLSLDHHQRLNLSVLLGRLECTIADTRAGWNLMDRLALDEAEKQAIGFAVHTINGSEAYGWNPEKGLSPREYDLSGSDVKLIQRAIKLCPRFILGQSRRWLKPLLAQMPDFKFDETHELEKHAYAGE